MRILPPNPFALLFIIGGLLTFFCVITWLEGSDSFWIHGLGALALSSWQIHVLRHSDIWRYDHQNRLFLRCRLNGLNWQILQEIPKNNAIGIASENIYLDGVAQFGAVWLMGANKKTLAQLAQTTPNKNGSLEQTRSIAQKIAEITALPLLPHHENRAETPEIRAAQPDDFQAAEPKKIAVWVIIAHIFWAMIFLVASAVMAWWAAQLAHKVAILIWIFDAALVVFALVWLNQAQKMWQQNRAQQTWRLENPYGTRLQRNVLTARKSGEFCLFSLPKYIFYTAIAAAMLLIFLMMTVSSEQLAGNSCFYHDNACGDECDGAVVDECVLVAKIGVSRRRRFVYIIEINKKIIVAT